MSDDVEDGDDDWRPSVVRGFLIGALLSAVLWLVIAWAVGLV